MAKVGMMSAESFGGALRRLRTRAGLTQCELAECTGLSTNAISALERGTRRYPYAHTVRVIASALGLNDDERAMLGAAAIRDTRVSELPRAPLPLIGREEDTRLVGDLLTSGRTRLLTLTGPGGVGKTRLAVAAAEKLAPHMMDGLAFVPLVSLRSPEDVMREIGHSLGLRELGDRAMRDILLDYLRTRHVLLVIDNFEHLLSAASDLADLLAAAPRLWILATSRAPLRVGCEGIFPVAPLTSGPSTELFMERAARVASDAVGFDATVVAGICERLDGLPLAIELAASRTRILSPKALLSRLDHSLAILTTGARDLPERHQTLRQTFNWSYDLLAPAEQHMFQSLAVLENGWSLDAAAAVAQVSEAEALDLHTILADSSMIVRESGLDEPRFRFLETIRSYATSLLEASGDGDRVRQRHAVHYRELALAAGPALEGPAQLDWLDRLQLEYGNLRLALRRLLDARALDDVARVCYALWRFWSTRGYLGEAQSWVDETLSSHGALSPSGRARLLFTGGTMRYPQGRLREAAAMLAEGATLARDAHDEQTLAWILVNWGFVSVHLGDADVGRALADEAAAIGCRVGDPYVVVMARAAEASAALVREHVAEADQILRTCEVDARQLGALAALGVALNVHGRVMLILGEFERAAALASEGADIFGRLQHVWGLMNALTNMADAAVLRSDPEHAAEVYGAVDALAERSGAAIFPPYRVRSEQCRVMATERLGVERFATLRQQGAALHSRSWSVSRLA